MLTEEDIEKANRKYPLANVSGKFWIFCIFICLLLWIPTLIVALDILGG